MNTRIKFSKAGPSKFIGHLDVMRYFQKAFRRADLDIEYSQGFSPHQLTSFASPLGVGLTSDGEYMDAQLHTYESPEIMIQVINGVMADDIQIVSFQMLPDNSKNAMSIVAAADYIISVKDGYEYMDKLSFEQKFMEFYKKETIIMTKKSKKSENEVDIKPFIYHIAFEKKSFYENIGQISVLEHADKSVADNYTNGIKVYVQLATGSVNNLKPELVMEAFCQYAGVAFCGFAYQVHRAEVYADLGDETTRKLVALDKMND